MGQGNERKIRKRNHRWTQMNPARRSRNRFGVRGLVRAFGRRLVAVECGKASDSPGPLDAALLWRPVAKAAKAVTSHRTPNSCRLRLGGLTAIGSGVKRKRELHAGNVKQESRTCRVYLPANCSAGCVQISASVGW